MGMHAHTHDIGNGLPPRARRLLLTAVGCLLGLTVVGVAVLWPGGDVPDVSERIGVPERLVDATVVAEDPLPCAGETDPGVTCSQVRLRLTGGPDEGDVVSLDWTTGGGSVDLSPGDRVVLGAADDPEIPPESRYFFSDFQRRGSLVWLGVLFAAAVVALGRFRGVRALLALVLCLLVITQFVLPSILEGNSPVAVSVVGAAVILVVALYLSHGFNDVTTSAVLGTLVSLALTGTLAVVFVEAAHLTGLASEEASFLQAFAEQVDVRGLLLGGIIIGSLGVLDDVTVTQASAVWELHQANPAAGATRLYRSALRIGRDHIASAVNTLVLAYAGASLPLLLVFTQTDRDLSAVLTSEVVAVEIVRTLVGSIGLVASVPVTTALTAFVVARAATVPAAPAPGGPDRSRRRRSDAGGDAWRPPRGEREWRDASGD